MAVETRPRDVQPYPLSADTLALRSRTWDRLKFEIEYGLQKGTTANSYLIRSDKTALIDPPGESFTEVFIQALQERFDLRTLDYIILGHTNPNRCATLKALLELAPQAVVVCSNPAAIALKDLLKDTEPTLHIIKKGDTLDLGKGHNLEFVLTPSPRYPGHLCTFDPATEILFTDKFFGAHVCGDQVLDEGWQVYEEDRRYYFDCIHATALRQTLLALGKIADKPATIYATGHGPLVRYSRQELLNNYQTWAEKQKNEISVALIYASAYGNTATVAQALARGISKAGVMVETFNAEHAEPEDIKTAIANCSGFIMGSPTLGGHAPTQIQTALGIVLANAEKTKLAGVFGSFGWSGEAIDLLDGKFKDAGYQIGFDPIRVKFKPTDVTLKTCEETGTDFAQALKKAAKRRKPKENVASTSQTANLEQALGRIVGSLCVITTKQDELSGAMLASWVSQATFNPPGFTVAVAKERAIESLMNTGTDFVINVLQEGNHLGLMKHFLKPFGPGEDRFEGVETTEAENGCQILSDALAYLECKVANRMECGDHWVIYATTDKGQLLQSNGITAIHHRKSGTHY
ncbi:flavin reductase domain protein FMN-binding protein [[Leptolyngbya] sp. PCC 7376]|uniref:diflavin flavoprotein n=1 Tax=[Leptolyngbya] sp. PCC 7376 TaxID=111781 RepID=UPI00029EE2D1|nr:diflavin flavoprotein [[Leptolyngbya] sp. PCC 7376]AFY38187.1 flavin reductase domain protein FMN-binding protein [[Leptolyngbya] sp. PCC 7376]